MTRMATTARTGVVLAGSAALCLSMTACGGKSSSKASSSASKAATAATSSAAVSTGAASSSAASSSKHSKTSAASASTSGTASCTKAKIGGVNKCIQAGQMCSHKHAADYKAFGFTCESKGNEYILRKV